jgi:hypothetical protein
MSSMGVYGYPYYAFALADFLDLLSNPFDLIQFILIFVRCLECPHASILSFQFCCAMYHSEEDSFVRSVYRVSG